MNNMRVSKSEESSPKIYSTSRIPELIKFIEYSIKTNKLNKAQATIADLESNVKIEIENLETDLCSSKKELELMQRTQGFLETEKIELEDEFRRTRRECDSLKEKIKRLSEDHVLSSNREKRTKERYAKACDELESCQKERDELNERITRLFEDQTVSSEREKRAEEQYAKLRDEYSKAEDEKHKMILSLNEQINELKNQNLGSEKAAEVYQDIIKSLDLKIVEMNSEAEKFKKEKLEADQNVKELRLQLLQADKTEEAYKKKFEALTKRIWNAEKGLAKVLNVDVNDIPNLANDTTRSPIIVNCPSFNGENASTGNGSKWSRDDADFSRKEKNGADKGDHSRVVHSACKSCESATEGQPAIISDHSEPIIKHLETAGCSCEMAKSLERVDIIEIDDSEDEATEQDSLLVSWMSKRKRSTNGNENKETFPIGVQKKKRRRELVSYEHESFTNDSLVKSKSVTQNQPLRGSDVSASIDSDDDSITSSRIDDILASG